MQKRKGILQRVKKQEQEKKNKTIIIIKREEIHSHMPKIKKKHTFASKQTKQKTLLFPPNFLFFSLSLFFSSLQFKSCFYKIIQIPIQFYSNSIPFQQSLSYLIHFFSFLYIYIIYKCIFTLLVLLLLLLLLLLFIQTFLMVCLLAGTTIEKILYLHLKYVLHL